MHGTACVCARACVCSERIAPGTWLRRNFPEWSLPHGGPGETLLNLGIPGAVEYISSYVSEAIQDFGLSVFRTDYNIDPLALWLGPPYADDATRRGMNEAHYIEGLYRFWVRNPQHSSSFGCI